MKRPVETPPPKIEYALRINRETGKYEYYVVESRLLGTFEQVKKHKWIAEDGIEFGTADQVVAYLMSKQRQE